MGPPVRRLARLPSWVVTWSRYPDLADVVLTDIRMPRSHTNEGIQAARRIRSRQPGVSVVVLSQYVEEDYGPGGAGVASVTEVGAGLGT